MKNPAKTLKILKWTQLGLAVVFVPLTLYSVIFYREYYWSNLISLATWAFIGGLELGGWLIGKQVKTVYALCDSYSELINVMMPVMQRQTEALKEAQAVIATLRTFHEAEPPVEKDSFDLH